MSDINLDEFRKIMQTLAQNKGISLNNLVIQCCEYALKNLDA